jgi:hypothetical protein
MSESEVMSKFNEKTSLDTLSKRMKKILAIKKLKRVV